MENHLVHQFRRRKNDFGYHQFCRPETIFTTCTSTIKPSLFAEATGRPPQFCTMHFHDTIMTKVVDMVLQSKTSEHTLRTVTEFVRELNQLPIVLKRENNGNVFNNMRMSLLMSALTMAQKEVTSIEEIDKSWMGVMHAPIGPFGIMDSVGLVAVWKITEYIAKQRNNPQAQANADFIKIYLDQEKQGVKNGEGFYQYH